MESEGHRPVVRVLKPSVRLRKDTPHRCRHTLRMGIFRQGEAVPTIPLHRYRESETECPQHHIPYPAG